MSRSHPSGASFGLRRPAVGASTLATASLRERAPGVEQPLDAPVDQTPAEMLGRVSFDCLACLSARSLVGEQRGFSRVGGVAHPSTRSGASEVLPT